MEGLIQVIVLLIKPSHDKKFYSAREKIYFRCFIVIIGELEVRTEMLIRKCAIFEWSRLERGAEVKNEMQSSEKMDRGGGFERSQF